LTSEVSGFVHQHHDIMRKIGQFSINKFSP
jgi:hypothetical protein